MRHHTRASLLLSLLAALLLSRSFAETASAGQARRPLEKVKMTVPAKSLTFFPYYFGKDKRIFEEEGIDIELIVIRPPIGIIALQAGELDYSAAGGLGMRAVLKGAAAPTIRQPTSRPTRRPRVRGSVG